MLILLGPSASGKTESAKIMINRYPISRVVTCTTRPKRINEIEGFDYHFLTEIEFSELENNNYFAETAKYNDFHYGTPLNEINDDKLIILEPQGLQSFLKLKMNSIVAIYLNTKESCRVQRMRERKDLEKDIEKRIESDRIDFDLASIKGLDLIIDTTDMKLSELADYIYDSYKEILLGKQTGYYQMSLFNEG
jgi:guanylate kinase